MLILSDWSIQYTKRAKLDLKMLDGSVRTQVTTAIRKVSQNPLPRQEGGYGFALGNKSGFNLSGYYRIKLKRIGIRVVYRLERTEKGMKIVVIGARSDNEVYAEALRRQVDD